VALGDRGSLQMINELAPDDRRAELLSSDLRQPRSLASNSTKRRVGRPSPQSATLPYAAASSRTRCWSDFRPPQNMHTGAP